MKKSTTKQELIQKLAQLESFNDQILSELEFLNQLLKQVGFVDGIEGLKAAAQDLLNEDNKIPPMDDDKTPPSVS
jgi:hypothetical protein